MGDDGDRRRKERPCAPLLLNLLRLLRLLLLLLVVAAGVQILQEAAAAAYCRGSHRHRQLLLPQPLRHGGKLGRAEAQRLQPDKEEQGQPEGRRDRDGEPKVRACYNARDAAASPKHEPHLQLCPFNVPSFVIPISFLRPSKRPLLDLRRCSAIPERRQTLRAVVQRFLHHRKSELSAAAAAATQEVAALRGSPVNRPISRRTGAQFFMVTPNAKKGKISTGKRKFHEMRSNYNNI